MEKRISYSQFQSVKCVAKACDPLISKRAKLKEKIDKLTAEYDGCDTQIKSLEAGIVTVIGFPVDMLVKKVIEPGIDVNGMPKKTTKYLPTDIVSYDEKHKQYIISVDETPCSPNTPTTPTESTTPQTESVTEDTMPVDTPVFE
nr:MAG TPA: hypothetical protein [Crassvirales sp.]